ncbi:universal stress protein [Anaeromyxobacter sp. SG17]|uniref:universal stress protein n=1 Tax=Anaeromyxobacter sp. SG17 TaxID=2925405 RepID=UPI001F5763F0|nr:universal stress protein [Anaeromyxobacter sp. SG17]
MAPLEWSRICCPVDFSEPAQAGLRVAADLCRRLGAELVLLYADSAARVATELPPAGGLDGELSAWKETAERLGAPKVTVARAGGSPEVAIVEFATSGKVDLIVMGTHGRVDREHMLTGSVAEGVVRNAPCPVLTVHPGWKA